MTQITQDEFEAERKKAIEDIVEGDLHNAIVCGDDDLVKVLLGQCRAIRDCHALQPINEDWAEVVGWTHADEHGEEGYIVCRSEGVFHCEPIDGLYGNDKPLHEALVASNIINP